MKRIIRDRRLTPEESAKYQGIRDQIAHELPDLIARHHERIDAADPFQGLVVQLKAARELKGLSLTDVTELTGIDAAEVSKLESEQHPNPTVETLTRYAEAVGKRLVISLADV